MSVFWEKSRPLCFELRAKTTGLAVEVHPQAAEEVYQLSGRVFERYGSNHGLGEITLPQPGKPWGFGKALLPQISPRPGWTSWLVPYHRVNFRTNESWVPLDRAFASLQVLSSILYHAVYQEMGERGRAQLVTLRINQLHVPGQDYSVGADLSREFLRWVQSRAVSSSTPETIREAMRRAWIKMDPGYREDTLKRDLSVSLVEPYLFGMSVPGTNGATLGPDYHDGEEEEPYTLIPHNLDNPLQVLTLFAGLAKATELARADGF